MEVENYKIDSVDITRTLQIGNIGLLENELGDVAALAEAEKIRY